jgi:hypothetical protein
MTTRLGLYNAALRLIGERKLADLSEDRKPRYVLDDIFDNGFIDSILEQGLWNFAMRAVEITKSTTTTPAFGQANAFDKPIDWIRTAGLCSDEHFRTPLLDYLEEVDFWFSDIDPIYVRYVSNAANYGNDLLRWPGSFTRYAEAYLAREAVLSLSQDSERQSIILRLEMQRRTEARSMDAMNEATMFFPSGSWTNSRHGHSGRRDRGNRGNLIG